MTQFHYRLVAVVTDPDGTVHPDVIGSFVWVRGLDLPDRIADRCLVKIPVADGTALTADTLAVLDTDADDVTTTALSGAQQTTWRNRLSGYGFDVSRFDADGPADRKRLLAFVLRRVFGWRVADLRTAVTGFQVGGD